MRKTSTTKNTLNQREKFAKEETAGLIRQVWILRIDRYRPLHVRAGWKYYSKRGQKHSRDFIRRVALKINEVNKICIRWQRSSSDKMRYFRDTNFYQGDRKGKPLTKCCFNGSVKKLTDVAWPKSTLFRYDYLEITDENSTTIGVYCGEQTGRTVDVTGSHIVITFYSDFTQAERGYLIVFANVSLCKSIPNVGWFFLTKDKNELPQIKKICQCAWTWCSKPVYQLLEHLTVGVQCGLKFH